jgi:hypothetical protein
MDRIFFNILLILFILSQKSNFQNLPFSPLRVLFRFATRPVLSLRTEVPSCDKIELSHALPFIISAPSAPLRDKTFTQIPPYFLLHPTLSQTSPLHPLRVLFRFATRPVLSLRSEVPSCVPSRRRHRPIFVSTLAFLFTRLCALCASA